MAWRSRAAFSERRRPEIFCRVFAGRRPRSAWFDVEGSPQVRQEAQDVGLPLFEAWGLPGDYRRQALAIAPRPGGEQT